MDTKNTFVKFYCFHCGKWMGVKEKSAKNNGIYPYCPRCKKNVPIVDVPNVNREPVPTCL